MSRHPGGTCYTLGYINAPSMFAGYLDKSQGGARKESLASFTPLINHVVDPNLWAVRPDSKFKTVKDVVDEAKRRPGTITLNGGGHGTDDHVAVLGISANTGTSFQMVHFRGTPEGKTQVLAGNIEVLACNVSEVAEDIRLASSRAYAVKGRGERAWLILFRSFEFGWRPNSGRARRYVNHVSTIRVVRALRWTNYRRPRHPRRGSRIANAKWVVSRQGIRTCTKECCRPAGRQASLCFYRLRWGRARRRA
jgi:hypothetical protein